jgi:hypothetical protein
MGIQSNKYTTITVAIIRIATTVDIMLIEFIDMVIGVIIRGAGEYYEQCDR